MSTVISVTQRKARKMHQCNACLFLFEADYRNLGATISEYRAISDAKKKNGKILPGERYEEIFYEDGGRARTFRQKPEINAICLKYDVYFE
jgi:hypothetical protein